MSRSRLVLLPGMDGTGTLFRALAEELAEDFPITIIKYPGNRKLTYPAIVQLVRSSLPTDEPYILLAESFSTPVAIACAALHDSNLKGLILCAGFARSPAPKWLRPLATLLTPVFFLSLPGMVAKWLLVGSTANKSLITAVRNAITSVKPVVLVQRVQAVLTCDVRRELSQTTVPLLYIRASRDRLIKLRSLEEIQSMRPDVLTSVIDGPHLILQEQPCEAAENVRAFIHQ